MKIFNKKTTKNNGQVTVSGYITTTKELELYNNDNNGLSPTDSAWKKKAHITIPAGSFVEYRGYETFTGYYHEITTTIRTGEVGKNYTSFSRTAMAMKDTK